FHAHGDRRARGDAPRLRAAGALPGCRHLAARHALVRRIDRAALDRRTGTIPGDSRHPARRLARGLGAFRLRQQEYPVVRDVPALARWPEGGLRAVRGRAPDHARPGGDLHATARSARLRLRTETGVRAFRAEWDPGPSRW